MTLLDRLAKLDSGLISDVLDEGGWSNHALAFSLRPATPRAQLVGRAACIRGEPIATGQPAAKPLAPDGIESIAAPGTIIVLATGGYCAAAPVGGLFCTSLMARGAAGLISDGA